MYRITIERIETVQYTTREWVKKTDTTTGEQYGYGEPVEQEKEVTREVYTQEVQNMDMKAVIKAVNEAST